VANRSVYAIVAPWRDNWVTKEAVLGLAPRPAPAPAGDSLLVSRFLPTREESNNRITLQRTTSAKNTRHRDSAPTAHTAER